MACCCFWFIHPPNTMTTNWTGFKTFRISAAHYLLSVRQRTNAPTHLSFQSDRVFGHNEIAQARGFLLSLGRPVPGNYDMLRLAFNEVVSEKVKQVDVIGDARQIPEFDVIP